MLSTIITSRTRILLLLTFFSNVRNTGFLRGLAEEFGDSTNSVRTELLRLADAGLILSRDNGRRRYYRANPRHPLFPELRNLVHKSLGLDQVRQVLSSREDMQLVLAIGTYARGRDSGTIELMIVGRDEPPDLDGIVTRAEETCGRAIRPFLFSEQQFLQLRRSLRLDHVLVLREDEGAAQKLLESFRDPRWEGDEEWRKDICWMTDTLDPAETQLDSVPRPSDPRGDGESVQPGASSMNKSRPSDPENDGEPVLSGPGTEDGSRVSEPESDGDAGENGETCNAGHTGNSSTGKKDNGHGHPNASNTRRKKHHFY